jgi:ribosomal protein S11
MGKKRIVKKGGEEPGAGRLFVARKRASSTRARLYVEATYNNTKVSLDRHLGQCRTWSSSGSWALPALKRARRLQPPRWASLSASEGASMGVKEVSVVVSGVGAGRESLSAPLPPRASTLTLLKTRPRCRTTARGPLSPAAYNLTHYFIGPKYKICKRLGASVFEKCQTQKFQLAEARARAKRAQAAAAAATSAHSFRKAKGALYLRPLRSQFSRYVHEAMEKKGCRRRPPSPPRGAPRQRGVPRRLC